jgi:hypothetical protein
MTKHLLEGDMIAALLSHIIVRIAAAFKEKRSARKKALGSLSQASRKRPVSILAIAATAP